MVPLDAARRVSSLPQRIEIGAEPHEFRETLKDGFWSAVGVYDGPAGQSVVKVYRERSWRGVPLRWIGRLMARREVLLLERVQGVEGVPRLIGAHGATGLSHEFVAGHTLQRGESMPAQFFEHLERLVLDLHARGVAYSDLSKRDNILVGKDGEPCLFDFQIGWCWPPPRGSALAARLLPGFLGRRILSSLQAADLHHVLKHRARHVPGDAVGAGALERLKRPAWPIRLMRTVSKPYHKARARRRAAD